MKVQTIGTITIALASAMGSWAVPAAAPEPAGHTSLAHKQARARVEGAPYVGDGSSPNYLNDQQQLLNAPCNNFGGQ